MSETAVVTGATGGIGQAVVGTLAANGYRVYAIGRAQDKLAAVQSADVVACTADLSRLESLPDPLADLDHVHALVHCAGVEVATLADTPRAVWDETFAVIVSGPASLTRALLPALRNAHGRIVFINAAPGLRAVPEWSAYTASNGGSAGAGGLAPRGGAPTRSARHDDLSGRRPNGALAQGQ